MSARVYLLLDVAEGHSDQVARKLAGKPGVALAEILEGPPHVIVMVEASGRQRLAELAIQALNSVEALTEGLRVLPVRADETTTAG